MNMRPNPYLKNAGYVAARKAWLGGAIVVYDRDKGFDIDSDDRWIVMHEPSSRHVTVSSRSQALWIMEAVAQAATVREAMAHADILPRPDLSREPQKGDAVMIVGTKLPALESKDLLRIDFLNPSRGQRVKIVADTGAFIDVLEDELVWDEEWKAWIWGRG